MYPLKSLDGQEDFVIVEFKNTGYAIYFKETGELLEYNAQGKSPYNKGSKKSYYVGPGNYFVSENDQFIHTVTGQSVEFQDLSIVSDTIRKLFSPSQEVPIESHNIYLSEPTGGGTVLVDMDEGTYIDNAWYFFNDPTHAEHDDDIDTAGTCTVIASQLLLGYHNYFSDRRIVPEAHLSDNFGRLDMRNDPTTLGTLNSFYYLLASYIDPVYNRGQTISEAKFGIEDYLSNNTPEECRENISLSYFWPIINNDDEIEIIVKNEIDNNRPLILGMSRFQVDSFHVVVCYGYRTYANTKGYIVHYGWNDHRFHVWTNRNWYFHGLTMEVGHTHTYEYLGGPYHELHCTECGQSDIRQTHTYTNRYVPYYTDTSMHYAYCTCGAYVFEGHSMSRIQSYSPEYHTVRCKKCFYQTQEEHFFKNGGDICVLCRYDKSGLT